MSNTINHEISLQKAIDMTTLYRANKPANFPLSETFDRDAIERLLSTDGCTSVRIYYGMQENMDVDAILVAANADNEDILPNTTSASTTGTDGVILEDGLRCPEACPPTSPLNNP